MKKLFQILNDMWEHYCPIEKERIKVAKGQSCNWCDTEETK